VRVPSVLQQLESVEKWTPGNWEKKPKRTAVLHGENTGFFRVFSVLGESV